MVLSDGLFMEPPVPAMHTRRMDLPTVGRIPWLW